MTDDGLRYRNINCQHIVERIVSYDPLSAPDNARNIEIVTERVFSR